MLINSLPQSKHYVSALERVGFTHFERKKKKIFINGQRKGKVLNSVIKTELRNAGYQFNCHWLNDVILILAANEADLEKRENIPTWMNPFKTQLNGNSPGPENRGRVTTNTYPKKSR